MRGADQIRHIVIAGAGTMGYSMGQIFAKYGYQVTIYDIFAQAIDKAQQFIALNQEIEVTKGTVSQEESQETIRRISYSMEIDCFKNADFVVEAILENLEIKHKFWQEVSALVPADIVLCSNTSGLSISKIAEKVKHPQRFLGMHWINPPHIIPLIEVIQGTASTEDSAAIVRDMARKVGKNPVAVKDAPGFVLNRIQFAIMRECLHIEQEGIADINGIDDVMKYGLGLRYACLGPFEVADFGGLDIFHNIASYLFADLSNATEDFGKLKQAYEKGQLGVKTKAGFYDYSGGKDEQAITRRNLNFEKVAQALYGK